MPFFVGAEGGGGGGGYAKLFAKPVDKFACLVTRTMMIDPLLSRRTRRYRMLSPSNLTVSERHSGGLQWVVYDVIPSFTKTIVTVLL